MKQKLNRYILMGILLPVILTSCLYEHPTMTDDGELGIDPTAVTVMADFGPALTSVVPNNELILGLAVCILAPLALFRGPLELYGAGSAVIGILMGMGIFDVWFLFAMLVVPSMTCISSCVTQSWNMWAVEYNELEPKTFLKNGVPVYWLCTFPIMGLAALTLF